MIVRFLPLSQSIIPDLSSFFHSYAFCFFSINLYFGFSFSNSSSLGEDLFCSFCCSLFFLQTSLLFSFSASYLFCLSGQTNLQPLSSFSDEVVSDLFREVFQLKSLICHSSDHFILVNPHCKGIITYSRVFR